MSKIVKDAEKKLQVICLRPELAHAHWRYSAPVTRLLGLRVKANEPKVVPRMNAQSPL